jgi:hypothetical protein
MMVGKISLIYLSSYSNAFQRRSIPMKYPIILTILVLSGCKIAKPACQIIDLADSACHVFILTDEKGNRQEIKMTGKEAKEILTLGQKAKSGSCK